MEHTFPSLPFLEASLIVCRTWLWDDTFWQILTQLAATEQELNEGRSLGPNPAHIAQITAEAAASSRGLQLKADEAKLSRAGGHGPGGLPHQGLKLGHDHKMWLELREPAVFRWAAG